MTSATMPPLVSVQRDLCFVEVIEGETDDLERQICESNLVERLTESGVSAQSIDINSAGCFVTVKCADVERLKAVAGAFNIAIRVQQRCGRICLRRDEHDGVLPSLSAVIAALHRKSIRIVQIVSDAAGLALIVDAVQVPAAMAVMNGPICRALPLSG
jgi:hypothetical protein